MREREGGPGLRCRHLLECRAAEGVSVSPALLAGERGLPLALWCKYVVWCVVLLSRWDGGSLRATWSQRHNGNRAIRAPQAVPFGTHAVQGVLRRFTGPYGASGRVGPALLLQNVRGSGGVASVISFGFRPELVSFARRWCLLISWDDY